MKILGLTGGSGTGKSTACEAFRTLGCAILDADASYRALCDSCTPMLEEIQNVFSDVLTTEGKLDRKKLGAVVFADPKKLKQLNAITHPYIRQAAQAALMEFAQKGYTVAVYDAPVLFEAGMETVCDCTCAILAKRETRISRIMKRDGILEEYAAMRIDAQQPDSFYQQHCDYVLYNDTTPDALFEQVQRVFTEIQIKSSLKG